MQVMRLARRYASVSPRIEPLEDRLAPATFVWDGGPLGLGTNWCDAANWSPDGLPGPGDDAQVGAAFRNQTIRVPDGCDATLRSVTSEAAVEVQANGQLALVDRSGATSRFNNNALRVLSGGTLRLEAVGLTGTGQLANLTNAGTVELATFIFQDVALDIPVVNRGMLTATDNCIAICATYQFRQPFSNSSEGTLRARSAQVHFEHGFPNDGRIELESAGSARAWLRTVTGALVNRHLIESRGTAQLIGDVNNEGTIAVLDGSLEFGRLGSEFTVTNASSGTIAATGGDATFTTLTFPPLGTTLDNQGTLVVAAGRTMTVAYRLANFEGGMLLGGAYSVAGTFRFRDADILTNAASVTLEDSGLIQDTSNPPRNALTNLTTNLGSLSLRGSAGFRAAEFLNAGAVSVSAESTFVVVGGTYTQMDGSTSLAGGLLAAGTIALAGGVLDGSGIVIGDLVNGGRVELGGRGAAGFLILLGAYTQNAGGALHMDLGGPDPLTQTDLFYVAGPMTLAGTLSLETINGYQPRPDDFFILFLTEQGINGDFTAFTGLDLKNDISLLPFSDGFGYYLFAYLR